jgi:hypothetical protein
LFFIANNILAGHVIVQPVSLIVVVQERVPAPVPITVNQLQLSVNAQLRVLFEVLPQFMDINQEAVIFQDITLVIDPEGDQVNVQQVIS